MDREPHRVERIVMRDRQTGTFHLRLRVDGTVLPSEGCDAPVSDFEEVADLPEDIEIARFCRADFPQLHDPRPSQD